MSLAFAFARRRSDGPSGGRASEGRRDFPQIRRVVAVPPSPDDIALAERIRAGDAEALETLVTRSYVTMLTYLTHAVGSEDVASDLLQELFMQIWRRRVVFPNDRPLIPYLVAAARHRVLDYVRTERRAERKLSGYAQWWSDEGMPGDPLLETEHAELVRVAREAVERLPDRSREIWRLSREQGLTFPEIAQMLGISVNTVKTQIARAMAALRAALAPFLAVVIAVLWP